MHKCYPYILRQISTPQHILPAKIFSSQCSHKLICNRHRELEYTTYSYCELRKTLVVPFLLYVTGSHALFIFILDVHGLCYYRSTCITNFQFLYSIVLVYHCYHTLLPFIWCDKKHLFVKC